MHIDFCEPPLYRHIRHLERVCSPREARAVRQSSNPEKALAVVWAAKEAAFKLLSKRITQLRFVPSQFEAQIDSADPTNFDKKLVILYADVQSEVRIVTAQSWVHAIAIFESTHFCWAVRELPKLADAGGPNCESEAVRLLASDLLQELGLAEFRLQFKGRIPRLERAKGEKPSADISLSHHGAYVAAVVAWSAGQSLPQRMERPASPEVRNSEAVCFTCTA